MFDFVFGTLRRGVERVFGNPQLIYTLVVALLIMGAFVFMAERFVGIANDAQERLVNVRVGSLQDAFVSFAADTLDDSSYLNARIAEITSANETISEFRVVVEGNLTSSSTTPSVSGFHIAASLDPEEVGKSDPDAGFLYTLAASDPTHSVTVLLEEGGERLFRTARAVVHEDGSVAGVAMTTQALSEADRAIEENIASSIALLIGVLFVIMLLFLRYSKVIDYMELYKKLKEVDQLKDDFISMASHELRTPLTVIRGYAEYIREAPELSPATKEYATHIDTSAQGLDALVADILDVSRIEQGRMSFTLETFAPKALVSEVVESFMLPAKEKGLALSFDATAANEMHTVRVDRDRLKQVLVNLVGNAIKYTLKGQVSVRQYIEKGRLVFRVSDTGFGMSAEEQKRLFEKFYRVKTEETKDIRGTGLGLWITAQIVRQMEGTISVESIKGVGSHFVVSFPLSTEST
ncbi:MAG: HAMP domain-containing sensor histidine kinase [Minisyncoccia bacterium]